MPDPTRGTDRAGRRSKRFLTPSQKYEIFLQLVRQEVTMMEAAEAWQVDRSTIMRIRTVAKQGALDALAPPSRAGRRRCGTTSWTPPRPMPPAWARRSRRWLSSSCWWRDRPPGSPIRGRSARHYYGEWSPFLYVLLSR